MEISGKSISAKITFDEFTKLISQEEWNRLYKKIADKIGEETGETNLSYDDCLESTGTIEFLVSN